jgi:hypothetical protein
LSELQHAHRADAHYSFLSTEDDHDNHQGNDQDDRDGVDEVLLSAVAGGGSDDLVLQRMHGLYVKLWVCLRYLVKTTFTSAYDVMTVATALQVGNGIMAGW